LATVLNSDLKALLKVYSLGIGTGRNKAGLTGRLPLNASTRYSNDAMQTLRQRGNELFGNQFSYDKDGMASLMNKAVVPLNQLT
jgi:hypothetical protein